jgi:DNA-binding winged helix-turn-helix (wHTH) protein
MRVFTPESPYYAPLPRKTMNSLFKSLFGPFSRGMSSTFLVRRGCGGGSALTKFLLLHIDDYAKDCAVAVSTKTHRYVYVEAPRGENAGPEEFTLRLCREYAGSAGMVDTPGSLPQFRDILEPEIRKKEIVFVVRGVNEMADYGKDFWSELSSLWFFTGRVHVLSIFYSDDLGSHIDRGFGSFAEHLTQSIVPFSGISEKDVSYSVRRWGYMLERTFSKREMNEISRLSMGCPALVKALCLASAQQQKGRPLKHHPLVVKKMGRISEDMSGDHELLEKCSRTMTSAEYRVMELLYGSDGVVYRSELAQALWGAGSENRYSDGAITQAIRRIRVKLEQLPDNGIRIRTMYGKGYALDRQEMGTGAARTDTVGTRGQSAEDV